MLDPTVGAPEVRAALPCSLRCIITCVIASRQAVPGNNNAPAVVVGLQGLAPAT